MTTTDVHGDRVAILNALEAELRAEGTTGATITDTFTAVRPRIIAAFTAAGVAGRGLNASVMAATYAREMAERLHG